MESPLKAQMHHGHDARLIDSGTISLEASLSGEAERYGRGKTSHTIHVWWARRPHGAMRALIFASLMPSDNGEGQQLMRELPFASTSDADVINEARSMLRARYEESPRVLDVFGGGGTIPYEAALLGAAVSSIDCNPLSVFIQKANLEFSQAALALRTANELTDLVREAGLRVLKRLEQSTADLFPLRHSRAAGNVFAYFWTYRLNCSVCGYKVLLMKRSWLSRKPGKHKALSLRNGERGQTAAIEDRDGSETFLQSVWQGRNGSASCPQCNTQHSSPSIQDCSDALVAVGELLKKGKAFRTPPEAAIPNQAYLDERERKLLTDLQFELPSSRLPHWSGIVNPALYGMDTHSDFLNKRQRLVMLELIGALREEDAVLERNEPGVVRRFVIAALSALIDQLVDWNCRLSMWISQNEQVGRAFCGPGVPMLWDYVETDPLLRGPANLWEKLERIATGVSAIPRFSNRPEVFQGHAQQLPFTADTFDAVITDPPYYDNLYYNVLADFFYAWKRPVLQASCPELFRDDQCDPNGELVASQFRHGDHRTSHDWYCAQLTKSLREITRVLKADGILSFIFAHSSLWGWDAIVKAFRHSGLVLTSAEPLSIERRQRPRAMTSEAVNTCIVLVGRKLAGPQVILDLPTMESRLRLEARTFIPKLLDSGWRNDDIGMAVFAKAVVMLANAPKMAVMESDAEALRHFASVVRSLIPEFRLQARESL